MNAMVSYKGGPSHAFVHPPLPWNLGNPLDGLLLCKMKELEPELGLIHVCIHGARHL